MLNLMKKYDYLQIMLMLHFLCYFFYMIFVLLSYIHLDDKLHKKLSGTCKMY